jgi:hypothetical protein
MEEYRFFDEVFVKKENSFKNAKKKTSKKKKEKPARKDNRIEKEYYEDVEITDPVTGKKYIQRVKVVRYKTIIDQIGKGVLEEDADDLKRTLDTFGA